MTRPPEYDQVARWLRVLDGDPRLSQEIWDSYPGPAGPGGRLSAAEHFEGEWRRLAEAGRALFPVFFDGIALASGNLDQVAEAYHQDQIAGLARRRLSLEEEIRQLEEGDFTVPVACARAARSDAQLEIVIEEYREVALLGARGRLAALPAAFAVTADEERAYWADRRQAAALHLIDGHRADPGLVAADTPTLRLLDGAHNAAHQHLDGILDSYTDPHVSRRQPPWGQVVIQAQADDWWARRSRLYSHRPEVLNRTRERQDEIRRDLAEDAERERRLHELIAQGAPGALEALNAELTGQALASDPPRPSPREDQAEWEAFFGAVLGRDMPVSACYEAESYRIRGAAPPDVGGMAAAYHETSYPRGHDDAELRAEREGLSWGQLCLRRYEELQAGEAAAAGPAPPASLGFPAGLSRGALGPPPAAPAHLPDGGSPARAAQGRTA